MRKLVTVFGLGLLMGLSAKPVYTRLFPPWNLGDMGAARTAAMEVVSHADVVMLGDSLTQWGEWGALLPGVSVANLGVSGDTVERIAARLPSVYRLKPKQVFLRAGTNNLYPPADVGRVFDGYAAVVADIQAHAICPIIQATPLVGSQYPGHEAFNRNVSDLNRRLEALAKDRGLTFVQAEEQPVRDYRIADGVHMNAAAYRRWAAAIAPLITAPRN